MEEKKKMGKSVLIVDDEEKWHILYATMLKNNDYELIHAYDGVEAFTYLEEQAPDLIILDMVMSMVNGDTFFLFIKNMSEYAGIPVIIISSYHKLVYEYLMDIDPNLVFLNKPVTKEKLIGEIKTKIG